MLRRILAIAFTLIAAFALRIAPASAEVAAGDLVKLQDDGNLETTVDSAVYFVGTDGKRYVFPNSQTYFTWYADFDAVEIVSPTEMAAMQIGGNITYRPGTRLVKITTDPKVYAVEPGGELRWVQTEAAALGLYGAQWNRRIDDVPDTFFLNYSIGDPLSTAVYPTGTVVRRSSDGLYFRIEDQTKRKIVSDAVRAALRIQDAFVITTTSDLAAYPNGPDIATAELAITDTSQRNLTAIPSVPTFSVKVPASSFIPVGGEATLMELHLATPKALAVTRVSVKIDATTNNPAEPTVDDDKGGLVYQNNVRANLTLIRFVDAAGVEVFGSKELAVNIAQDQSQTLVFTGTFSVPAGTDKVLYLRAATNALLPNSEGYKATLLIPGTDVTDVASGSAAAFQPTADLAGPVLTTLASFLEVMSSATPGSKTHVRGARAAEINGLTYKATVNAPNVIKSITFQGYIDEEGTGGFLAGGDADNGTQTLVRDLVPTVDLYDSAGAKLAGPVSVTLEGKATFTGLNVNIQPGTSAVLVVRGDLSSTVDIESAPNKVMFDITDAKTDVTVVDDKGAAVPTKGVLPNGGNSATFFATIRKNGTANIAWAGGTAAAIAGRESLVGTLTVTTAFDAYDLKVLSFHHASPLAASLGGIRLEYPTGATTAASVAGQFIGTTATFTNLPIVLDKDKTTTLKLYASVRPRDAGAVYGERIKVKFGDADPFQLVSKTNGETFSESSLSTASGSDFLVSSNLESAVTVRFSGLTAAKTADSPAGGQIFRSSESPLLKFTLTAAPEGGVRVKTFTFKISPGDAGQTGADNDSLERWADVHGDFLDDDNIASLMQIVGTARTPIAEGTAGHVRYSIVQGGVKKTEPSTLTSAAGDYALIEFSFDDGSEFSIGPGGTMTFQFELDTGFFNSVQDWALSAELLGAADFLWTDVPSGAYTPLTGTDAFGLSLTASGFTVKK